MHRHIRCIDCARFLRSATSPEVGLGSCPSARLAWDGYSGQWPRKQHPCAAFVPFDTNRGEPLGGPGGASAPVKSPRHMEAAGRPEARKNTPGAESAAPGHPHEHTADAGISAFVPGPGNGPGPASAVTQPPTAGAPRAIGGAPALSATPSAETGGDVPTGSVSRPGQGGSDIGALPPNAPRTEQNPNPPARQNGAAGGLFPEGA